MKKIAVLARQEIMDSQARVFVNATYIDAIMKQNVLPIIVRNIEALEEISDYCDGLLIPGGYDVDPKYFNQDKDEHTQTYESDMDELDLAGIDAFIRKDKPILGICRGIQILNVYFNGTLIQHIDKEKHEAIKPLTHHVIQCDTSLLSSLYPQEFIVNSYHHQCIGKLGDDLIACAKASDGVIEALHHKDKDIFAVQWHPERLEDDLIIPWFLNHVL